MDELTGTETIGMRDRSVWCTGTDRAIDTKGRSCQIHHQHLPVDIQAEYDHGSF